MTDQRLPLARATPPPPAVDRTLRLVAASALGVSAYVHVALAAGPLVADGQVTLAGLFVGQAVVAAATALWVLARGSGLAWLATAAVGGASVGALVLTVYVLVPSIGPLPAMYEPFWYPQKVVAASAAGVALVAALVALLARRASPHSKRTTSRGTARNPGRT